MDEFKSFYNMVKEWTKRDYRTQGVKSEVIIDMLISDFVKEMIAARLKCNIDDVKLLAKEFPIRTYSSKDDKSNRNAKVDYLVLVKNNLYLVELKTTDDSLNTTQIKRMKRARKNGVESLCDFFFGIIGNKKLKKNARRKYEYTLNDMREELDIENGEDIKDVLMGRTEDPIKIMYICLCKNDKCDKFSKDNDASMLYLDTLQENDRFLEYLKDRGKQSRWEKLLGILNDIKSISKDLNK